MIVKRIITLFFCLSCFLQSWAKTIVFMHFQLNRQEIADTQCTDRIKKVTMCYGSCVLQQNIAIVERSEQKDEAPVFISFAKEVLLFSDGDPAIITPAFIETLHEFGSYRMPEYRAGSSSFFHPPPFAS